ncbi:MAG: hypothetical protein JW910_19680 [Anaerolineae bacterium]|nr:hypothetical protein [Anaerolineae bacterium]
MQQPSTRRRTPEQQHRRDTFLQITLPMLGALGFMALLLLAAILALDEVQFGMVADQAMMVCMLIPTMLLCLIPTLLMLAIAVGAWALNQSAATRLARLRNTILKPLGQVRAQVPRLAQPVIALQSRLSYSERLVSKPLESLTPGPSAATQEEDVHGSRT